LWETCKLGPVHDSFTAGCLFCSLQLQKLSFYTYHACLLHAVFSKLCLSPKAIQCLPWCHQLQAEMQQLCSQSLGNEPDRHRIVLLIDGTQPLSIVCEGDPLVFTPPYVLHHIGIIFKALGLLKKDWHGIIFLIDGTQIFFLSSVKETHLPSPGQRFLMI